MNNIEQIYVINLKRRPDRLEEFKKFFPLYSASQNKNQLTFFEATDAKSWSKEEKEKYYKQLFPNGKPYREVVRACAVSHYRIWKEIASKKDDGYYCIFEDDCFFKKTFEKEWNEKICKDLPDPSTIDIIYMMNKNDDSFDPVNKYIGKASESIIKPRLGFFGAFSYIVSRNGARKLIEHVRKVGGINDANDWFIIHNWRYFNIMQLLNPLTFSLPGYKSDLRQNIVHERTL